MANPVSTEAGCLFVGEFSDVAAIPAGISVGQGEVGRPLVVAESHDAAPVEGFREFTVLLTDGRVVAVRGHTLKHVAHPVAGQDVFSVVIRSGGQETVTALFKSADVAGIFDGELRPDRQIA